MLHLTNILITDKKHNELILAMKQRRYGKGKWNGYGGKIEPGENIKQAALRELLEESQISLAPSALKKVAEIVYQHQREDEPEMLVHVFTCDESDLNGQVPKPTEEMIPQRFSCDAIPYHDMWQGDIHWIQPVLEGKTFKATFAFKGEQYLHHSMTTYQFE